MGEKGSYGSAVLRFWVLVHVYTCWRILGLSVSRMSPEECTNGNGDGGLYYIKKVQSRYQPTVLTFN